MRRIGHLMVVALLAMGLMAGTAFAVGNPTFGVTTNASKIGDAYGTPTWGGGFHSIAVKGSEVFAGFTDRNVYNETEVVMGHSYDGGQKWERNEVVAHGQINSDGVALAIGPDPNDSNKIAVHMVWSEYDAGNSKWVLKYSRRTNNSWSTPKTISGSISPVQHRRTVAADPLGGVHVAFNASGVGQDVYYIGSSDYGDNFASPYYLGSGNAEPSIAADSQGNVFVAWNQYTENTVLVSKRISGNWSTVQVNGSYGENYPSIAVYDASNIYVAWRNSGSGSWPIVVAKTSDGGTNWTQTEVSSSGDEPCIVVDGTNTPSVSWDGQNGVTFSRWMGNKWATPTLVVEDGWIAHLAVDTADSTNKIYMMYSDNWGDGVYFTLGQ